MNGTYGLTPAAPRTPGFGSGLVGLADTKEDAAFGMSRAAAQNETNLNIAKDRAARERKAGNAQLGSTVGGLAGGAAAGAMYGSSAGLWGALIGGVIGAVAGGAF